jgi:carbon-monoxide dehydrogenase large subunit
MRDINPGRFVGTSVKRVEDPRLLTGNGSYIADVEVPNMVHAAFARSPYPHAEIKGIDATRARTLAGVHAVITGEEMQKLTNPFVPLGMTDGLYTPLFWPLAIDRVRMVGDPVAIVIADSRYIAEDAIELIEVDYEPIDTVATMTEARSPNSEPIWPKADGNVLMDSTREYGNTAAVFAQADHVFRETFHSHRHSNQPMETRGCVAELKADELVFHSASQNSHGFRWVLAMATGKRPVLESLKTIVTERRDRLKAFAAGAKAFADKNKDELAKNDNAGAIYQMKKDPSTAKYLGRIVLNTFALGNDRIPRVVADDIGGAFGVKGHVGREDAAVIAAALKLGRSVKWIEDRNEHLMIGGQAREESMTIEVAANSDGEILGFKVDMTMDQGAYPAAPVGASIFTGMIRAMMPGTYRLKAFEFTSRIVTTNKAKYVAYRGPWATETWVRERMLDVVARELGMSAAEIRLRNMYGTDELPTRMVTGPTLDVRMSARTTLERAIDAADLPAFREQQEAARAEGRILGVGIATFHEAAPGPPDYFDAVQPGSATVMGTEPARTLLEADGTVSVFTSQMPHGQSHETTYAQVAADQLGLPMDQVNVVFGDSSKTEFSMLGTGGSRGGPMGGGATQFAARDLREKILDEAADMLEANRDDLEITDGDIHVAGVPAISRSFADVATTVREKHGAAGTLEGLVSYDGGPGGWVQATHVCFVEIDLDTGFVKIPRYVVVEDCGEMINPAVVEGQIRGGVAQGVGAVLYEKSTYDADANFQAGTFMDYLIPTSMEIPDIEIIHVETPSDIEANWRGVGEGGMIGAPAAITNAIEDALAHRGVRITEQHLPPTRILELAGVIPEA